MTLQPAGRPAATRALLAVAVIASVGASPTPDVVEKNVVVYREGGRYGGWPANHGIWSWGDEILVGFEIGYLEPKERGHAIDYARPAEHVVARSLDGGETWSVERPEGLRPPPGAQVARVPAGDAGRPIRDLEERMDVSDPDFAFTARMEDIHVGPSRFYYSVDRGRSWRGPFALPDFGFEGIAARTDYLVDGKGNLTAFLTAAKRSDGKQGRTICVRTADGGLTWKLVSLVGEEPPAGQKAIMPSSVRLEDGTIVTAVRRKRWIDTYRSRDEGETWTLLGEAVAKTGENNGNPPRLTLLADGNIALTYGFRSEPYGIRARLSRDGAESWGEEIVLRDDAGAWDLGYTRTVQREDGKLVTVYYYNDSPDGERYIGATIWDPARVEG
jgi:hypothetical protein